MEQAEELLRRWAYRVEASYPKRIEEAKKEKLKSRISFLSLYALAAYLWIFHSSSTTLTYIAFIPFLTASALLLSNSSQRIRELEEGRVRVAKYIGKGDYASAITWQYGGASLVELQKEVRGLKAAGIDLHERSQHERKEREQAGLYW